MCKTWYFRQPFLFIVWSFFGVFYTPRWEELLPNNLAALFFSPECCSRRASASSAAPFSLWDTSSQLRCFLRKNAEPHCPFIPHGCDVEPWKAKCTDQTTASRVVSSHTPARNLSWGMEERLAQSPPWATAEPLHPWYKLWAQSKSSLFTIDADTSHQIP